MASGVQVQHHALTFFSFVPVDYNRVVLNPLPAIPDSDYINASYVDVTLNLNLIDSASH